MSDFFELVSAAVREFLDPDDTGHGNHARLNQAATAALTDVGMVPHQAAAIADVIADVVQAVAGGDNAVADVVDDLRQAGVSEHVLPVAQAALTELVKAVRAYREGKP